MQVAPGLKRVAVIFNPDTAPGHGTYFLTPIEATAASYGIEVVADPIGTVGDLEAVVASIAREPGGGLIVVPEAFTTSNREPILSLAERYHLPGMYPFRFFSGAGGLISYGVDAGDLFRRGASYVDLILRGEKPSDLPVQAPTKFELVINLKTADALGLSIPPILLARADEVIE